MKLKLVFKDQSSKTIPNPMTVGLYISSLSLAVTSCHLSFLNNPQLPPWRFQWHRYEGAAADPAKIEGTEWKENC